VLTQDDSNGDVNHNRGGGNFFVAKLA